MQLGNLYFDAERYDEAIKWYGDALKLAPNDVNVSTDLGVSYYYTNQPDKALEQFDHSLKLDPKHGKTLLNVGIVKAFGKQDLDGAAQAWQRSHQARARQSRRAGGEARARQPAVGAPGGDARFAGRRRAPRENPVRDAAPDSVRAPCLFVARALWRLLDGIVDGASGGQSRGRAPARGVSMVRDPVCGTFVLPASAVTLVDGRARLYFCSDACRDKYRARTA